MPATKEAVDLLPKAKELLEKWVNEYLVKKPIVLGTPKLDDVLDDGRYKTQFETGKSRGYYDPMARRLIENHLFDVPMRARYAKRPVYGALRDLSVGHLPSYGQYGLVLKHDVKPKSTFSLDDSFNIEDLDVNRFDEPFKIDKMSPLLTGILHPFTYLNGPRQMLEQVHNAKDFSIKDMLEQATPYIEAQVHKPVTLDDVSALIVPSEQASRFEQRTHIPLLPYDDIHFPQEFEDIPFAKRLGFRRGGLAQMKEHHAY